jgi:hypothetical protein
VEPDNVEVLPNGVYKYFYGVSTIKKLYDHMMARHVPSERYRSCYHCKGHFRPEDLHSVLCPLCYAKKVVLNYGCHGDPMKHSMDFNRLDVLIEAIKLVKDSYEEPIMMYD